MRILFASLAATAIWLAASTASGQEVNASITKIDHKSDRIILDNGQSFDVSEDIAIESLSEGVEVRITYRDEDGKRIAVGIAAVDSGQQVHHVACTRHTGPPGG